MVHQMISNRTASVRAAAQRLGITDLRNTSKKKKITFPTVPQFWLQPAQSSLELSIKTKVHVV